MIYSQCEAWIKEQIKNLYAAGEAAAIADWILEEYTGNNRQQRRLIVQEKTEDALPKIENAVSLLLQGKPVQYVLGYTEFYGLRLTVNEFVLIPRPETEELVNWVLSDYRAKQKDLKLLDIGTGSGCIAVTLKKNMPAAFVSAIDISVKALHTTMQNASYNLVDIHFQQLDFLNEMNWPQLAKYEVVVSNPPYIPQQEKGAMDKNVTAWEPATALFVPDESPLLFYEKIALFGKTHLLPGGTIYLETHKDFAIAVQQLFVKEGYVAVLKKDMHGNDRMVKAVNSQ